MNILIFALCLSLTATEDIDSHRVEQRKSYDALVRNLSTVSRHGLRDVFRLSVESGLPVLRTRLPSSEEDEYWLLQLDKLPDGLLRVQGGSMDEQLFTPSNFSLSLNDYSRSGQISTLTVTSDTTSLMLSKSVQLADGHRNVQFIRYSGNEFRQASVMLVVSENIGVEPCLNISHETTDMSSLLLKYPDDSHVWLRPLLRELGQEHLMAPDTLVAWQVLSDQWKPNPETEKKARELLYLLDDEDYRTREKAVSELRKLGKAGALALVHLDRSRMSNEQRAGVDRILSAYSQISGSEAQAYSRDLHFLLDCLYSEDLSIRKAAMARLRELTIPDLRFDPDLSEEKRMDAIARLREILTKE